MKDEGKHHFHNGPTLALARITQSQIGAMEEPMLYLKVRPSDYFTLRATALSLNDVIDAGQGKTTTVRDKYLRHSHYAQPVPEFASALSINLSVLTSDDWIIVSKRSPDVGSDPGFLAPAINECVNPVSDMDTSGTISFVATAKRAASHELNIEITEDEVVFFTIGVDTRWYFYQLTGLVRSKFSRDDIRARLSQGSAERWEADKYLFIKNKPMAAAKFLSESREKWTPYGIVCLMQTLVSEYGTPAVERALEKYPPPQATTE